MKRRPKKLSRPGASSGDSQALNWIALLLGLILVVSLLDLYLSHFRSPRDASEQIIQGQSAVTEQESNPVSEPARENPVTVEERQAETQPDQAQAARVLTASDVKLQILNGCGVRGIAARVRSVMRDRGFDVMSYGNAENNEAKTVLLVRSEGERGMQAARIAAASIGAAESQIRRVMDPSIVDIDVTIIIGGDHRSLNLE